VSEPIEQIVARLNALYPQLIDLSLGRLSRLLARLGNPERRLPPVIHVAGTNGKGSTCAFLKAIAEAAGMRVHMYTSPHLVRFNERIVLAGREVNDEVLADALKEVERVNNDEPITIFEVITATAFLLFSRVPAELTILEVGLGGRYDATNVIPPPLVAAITSISIDHREFLGDTLAAIAFQKAGILKSGSLAVTGAQESEAASVLNEVCRIEDVPLYARGREWEIHATGNGMEYQDQSGSLTLPEPGLPGPYQRDNAGIAVTALRLARLGIPERAFADGLLHVHWPARLQRLNGRLARLLPAGSELWLDGGHNPGAGIALAQHMASWRGLPTHLVIGMKSSKDAASFLLPLIPQAAAVWAVAEPGQYGAMPVEAIIAASGGAARPGVTVTQALRNIAEENTPVRVLICGSLYLAGEVLKQDQPASVSKETS